MAGDIHKARVASRRLREMLPLMDTGTRKERRDRKLMRRVTRGLGRLREADVLAELLDKVTDSTGDERTGVAAASGRAAGLTATGRSRSRREGASGGCSGAPSTNWNNSPTVGSIVGPRWNGSGDARSTSEITARVHGLLQAMDDAGVEAAPERVHRVRIAVKKLRYVVELSEELARMPPSGELRRLSRAQSLLGRLHDRQVLLGAAATVRASLARRDLRGRKDLSELLDDLEATCQALHATYVRSRAALHRACQNLLAARPKLT